MRLTVSMLLVAAATLVAPLSLAQAQSTANPDTRLAAMVPAGMTTESACTGFKSLSDCSAALHALQPSADPKEVRRAEDQAREDLKPGS